MLSASLRIRIVPIAKKNIWIALSLLSKIQSMEPKTWLGYGNGNQVKQSTMAAAELKQWFGSQANGGSSISVSLSKIQSMEPKTWLGYGNGNQVNPSTMAAAELKQWFGSQANGGSGISVSLVLFWNKYLERTQQNSEHEAENMTGLWQWESG